MPRDKKAPSAPAKPAASRVPKAASRSQGNDYPIVLVHGMCGWGRDEIFGQQFRYWGGLKGDIQEYLISKGYQTFTASMGPLSSNWDRACELYAFLRGGMVDYGAVHSARFGHARYGRCYPGVFPQWSETEKVHLIGHSMGGPTSRTLIQLLEHGDPDEMAFVPSPHEAPSSDLFSGGKKWVHSLTSVAGVHNGTAAADNLHHEGQVLADLLLGIATFAGLSEHEAFYDFNLPQWGLGREHGQSHADYIRRALESPIWKSSDTCIYDLSTAAAHFQNNWARTSEHVYYTSYVGDATVDGPLGVRIPEPNMFPPLLLTSAMLGQNTRDMPGGFAAWRPNDGCVPVPSAQFPFGHRHEFIAPEKTGTWEKGVWYVHPTLKSTDHMCLVVPSVSVTIEQLNTLYEGMATHAQALPA